MSFSLYMRLKVCLNIRKVDEFIAINLLPAPAFHYFNDFFCLSLTFGKGLFQAFRANWFLNNNKS